MISVSRRLCTMSGRYAGRGRGRGRGGGGGGPPPGLSGKQIGLWYKDRSKGKKKEKEINERTVLDISRDTERSIHHILEGVKQQPLEIPGGSRDVAKKLLVQRELISSEVLDKELVQESQARSANQQFQKMLDFRKKLPSWKMSEELLSAVRQNQVMVVSGETGCGKTTQVPQFILDEAIASGRGSQCHVICTQPRRISAISVAQRVADERAEALGKSVGFQIRLEGAVPRAYGSILYCTTGILLRRMASDPLLSGVSHVVLDEVHERSIQSDFLAIIIRDLLPKRRDLKVILMSATLNAHQFSSYFCNAPTLSIPGRTFPVTEYFLEDVLQMTRYCPAPPSNPRPRYGRMDDSLDEDKREMEEYVRQLQAQNSRPPAVINALRNFNLAAIDLQLMVSLIQHISLNLGPGSILVFLPGWDSISKLHDMLKANPVFSSSRYRLIPLHSMMPTAFQKQVFERPPEGVRKIVIATNIAETSITIDDVVYVLDCGKIKETTYNPVNQLACLEAVWVSKANARQRKGRAGRVQPGQCFHLFTAHKLTKLADYQDPEIVRTPLEELVLQIKLLGLGDASSFLSKAIDPPSDLSLKNALSTLRALNALDSAEQLTPLGHHLAHLPVHPRIGKIILFGAIFSCLDPVLTIASALGFKEPFVIPLHKQSEADAVKRRFAGGTRSDHLALLAAYQGWQSAWQLQDARSYCWQHFLSSNTLELLKNMKVQFAGLLHDIGFIDSPDPSCPSANVNSHNHKLVKAVLCAGLYPNVAKIVSAREGRPPKLYTQEDGRVHFHPKSINVEETDFESKFLLYHTKLKSSKVFLHDTTAISPFPLLFFGGDLSVQERDGQETIAVDEWMVFQAPTRTAQLVKDLRQQLDHMLRKKVARPSLELYTPSSHTPSPSSQLIEAIITLITREDYSRQVARLAAGRHLYGRGKQTSYMDD